jgi:hypothetical protein
VALNLACVPLSVVVGQRALARDRPDPGLWKVIPSGQGTIGPLNFEPLNMIDDCPWTTRKPAKIEVGKRDRCIPPMDGGFEMAVPGSHELIRSLNEPRRKKIEIVRRRSRTNANGISAYPRRGVDPTRRQTVSVRVA